MHCRLVLLALLVTVASVSRAEGQVIQLRANGLRGFQSTTSSDGPQRRVFITDRTMGRRLSDAQRFLSEEPPDYTRALLLLQRILDSPEDAFYQVADERNTTALSLRSTAQRLIAELPPRARALYEDEYGIAARKLLEQAIAESSTEKLEEVSRRFFHTKAGHRAMYFLGSHHLDRARPLAAALCFQLLQRHPRAAAQWEPMLSVKLAICLKRAGMSQESLQALTQLSGATKGGAVRLAGRDVPLFERAEDALAWFEKVLGPQPQAASIGEEQWAVFRGSASRNASSVAATPVWDNHWQFSTIREYGVEDPKRLDIISDELKELQESRLESGELTLPAKHPLVVDDVVIARSLGRVKAVDLHTGELLWETAVTDPAFDELLQTGTIEPKQSSYAYRRTSNQFSMRKTFLSSRCWQDLTHGTIASDGTYVFTIEENAFRARANYGMPTRGQSTIEEFQHNKLMAFELRDAQTGDPSGKLKWEIGGPVGKYALELAGTYFLGPPLPLGGHLYCLGETHGELQLLVLDPRQRGKLIWMQPLPVDVEIPVEQHPSRRTSGLTPAFKDGVMICPTDAGAVVAFDLSRRVLLWGYGYNSLHAAPERNQRRFMVLGGRVSSVTTSGLSGAWADAVPTIAKGHVLLTPRDSGELHCVRLIDGALLWKRPRGPGLYVAAVHGDNVVIVEENQVRAVKLQDGSPAWSGPTTIDPPSGRGFRVGNLYHLPMSSAEIATIFLDDGRIIARTKSRNGQVHGNLVAAGGTVVSQSIDGLTGFRAVADLEGHIASELAKNPNSHEVLALRGSIELHRGNVTGALKDLRHAIELGAGAETKRTIVSTLLEGMRLSFAAYRSEVPEIRKLIDDPAQRSTFLRLYADGLRKTGDHRGAFSEYLKLSGPDTGAPKAMRIDGTLEIRSDRWVRARLGELYEGAPLEQRNELDREIRDQFTLASRTDKPDDVMKFIGGFSDHPIAEEARLEFVRRGGKATRPLAVELQLLRLRESKTVPVAGFATARLARLLIESGRAYQVSRLLAALESRFADVVCLNEQTGAQLAQSWRADAGVRAALERRSEWPRGVIESTTAKLEAVSLTQLRGRVTVPIYGSAGEFFDETMFVIDSRAQQLEGLTLEGVRLWSVALSDPDHTSRLSPSNSNIRTYGHLLVLATTSEFLVIDALGRGGSPELLWRRSFGKSVRSPFGPSYGAIGPISDEAIIYQQGTKLCAADPITGDVLWQRDGVPAGSEVIGDRRVVVAASPSGELEGVSYGAVDGHELGHRGVPKIERRLAVDGVRVVDWVSRDGARVLLFVNRLTGKTLWSREFPDQSVPVLVETDEVAVFEPSGALTVLSIADGGERLTSQLDPALGVADLCVIRSADQYVVMTYSPGRRQNAVTIMPIGGASSLQMPKKVNGPVYALSRTTGKRLWRKTVEDQVFYALIQPRHLPILVFASRRYGPRQPNARGPQWKYDLLAIDGRTGKTAYQNVGTQSLTSLAVESDPKKKQVFIKTTAGVVTLSLTDKPQPAETKPTSSPDGAADEKPKDESAKPAPSSVPKPGS
ncbi:MAG: hypothetical protein CMJ48_05820 [Planctomycetaceae bacterium]|nr:hypothetical protein [Planctomycetaceae bacterium]